MKRTNFHCLFVRLLHGKKFRTVFSISNGNEFDSILSLIPSEEIPRRMFDETFSKKKIARIIAIG